MGSAHMSQVCRSGSGGGRVAIRRSTDNGFGACGVTGTVRPSDAHRDGNAEHTITMQQRQRLEMVIAVRTSFADYLAALAPSRRSSTAQANVPPHAGQWSR